jgi:hypothetical protein
MERSAWRKAALAKAEEAIARAEVRVTAQILHLEQLRASGQDTIHGERLLDRMYRILLEMNGHRETLLQIERG